MRTIIRSARIYFGTDAITVGPQWSFQIAEGAELASSDAAFVDAFGA